MRIDFENVFARGAGRGGEEYVVEAIEGLPGSGGGVRPGGGGAEDPVVDMAGDRVAAAQAKFRDRAGGGSGEPDDGEAGGAGGGGWRDYRTQVRLLALEFARANSTLVAL